MMNLQSENPRSDGPSPSLHTSDGQQSAGRSLVKEAVKKHQFKSSGTYHSRYHAIDVI